MIYLEHLKIIDTRDLSTVFQLLSLLPLLRPGNTEAAMIFTEIIPQCVNVCLEQSKNLEESRQLISYALIHPALSSDQRSCLSSLLLILDQKCNAHTYSSEKVSRLELVLFTLFYYYSPTITVASFFSL